MFSDYQQHVLGVPESKKLTTPDSGPAEDFAFRTPSLSNLRFTAPYMHNDSFTSLRRVLAGSWLLTGLPFKVKQVMPPPLWQNSIAVRKAGGA